jgi:hypothetical protein
MGIRVCNQGEEAWLTLVTAVTMDVRLFTNDVESGLTGTQVNALTEADFTEATFAGYAPVEIIAANWGMTPGNPTVALYNQPATFTRSSTGSPQTVRGYYVTRTSDDDLIYHEYFATAAVVELDGDQVDVTARITLKDEDD